MPIQANQNSSRQIANVFRSLIVNKDGIEGFGLAVQAEMKHAARLCACGRCDEKEGKNKSMPEGAQHYARSSGEAKIIWKQITTKVGMTHGANDTGEQRDEEEP